MRHIPAVALLALTLLAPTGPARAAPTLEALHIAHSVERGRPIDVRDRYTFADGRIYVWLHLRDATAAELRWYLNDNFQVADRLKPTGRDWRTWMRRRFRPGDGGRWRVEVRIGERVIGEARFVVEGDEPIAAPAAPPPATPPPAAPPPAAPPPAAPPPAAPPVVAAALPATVAPAELDAPPEQIGGCRALLNLRTSPAGESAKYAVADVRFGRIASIDHTAGLLLTDGEALHALHVRRREHAARAWDELMSVPLRSRGAVRRWRRLPGAQPLPAPGDLREDNRLEVISIIGPYLGLRAQLSGRLNGRPFDNSRYLTVQADGTLVDLRATFGPGLEIMVGRHVDPQRFDFRRIALQATQGLIAHFQGKHIPLFAPPPRLRPFSPDEDGVWRNGDCAIKLAGHRVAASRDDAPFREVRAPRLLPFALLGVTWLEPDAPPIILPLERAMQRFARVP